ncbi:MAG: amidophosphoribosyltransferase [Dehalococcoidales bacterium]|nr:amidophosphoribosyltransferase [Dehalococcoidales bacterium]
MNLHEKCGVFGIYCPGEDVARLTFFALFALQHRGQESAGIATADGKRIQLYGDMGLVSQVFDEGALSHLTGHIAIGHNRYSTTGSSRSINIQPIVLGSGDDTLAIAHNGNIVNASHLYKELCDRGFTFHTSSDTEVIGALILSAPAGDWVGRIKYAMRRLQGAYSLTLLTKDALYAIRDPWGVRPLCFGSLNGGWVAASESCALDHIGATLIREVEPGEIIRIDQNGTESFREPIRRRALCIFEFIYFARPDSIINGQLIYPTRQAMGARLAIEHPVDVDVVMGVPDSATAAGLGYAQQSGKPFSEGLLKNRYVGRTFIAPDQRIRDLGVKLKFNPLPQLLKGQRMVVVDDSIVRGTTTPKVVNLLRRAGVKEVHMRICAPPIRYPCFFGVDMATRRELIAAHKSVEEIRKFIGADSLGYMSLDGLMQSVKLPRDTFCTACFTGDYPVPVQLEMDKLALENAFTERS